MTTIIETNYDCATGSTTIKEVLAPVTSVPEWITAKQFRLTLLNSGHYTAAESFILGITGSPGTAIQIEWEYGTEFYRNSPFVTTLAEELSLTETEIDQLFIDGSVL